MKLKFNRLWLCFNGLAYLLLPPDHGGPSRSRGVEMATLKPVQRLAEVAARAPELAASAQQALDCYGWWLEKSAGGSEATRAWMKGEDNYTSALARATEFGDAMHDIVKDLAERRDLGRFLLV
jgi:hypothetical protein